MSNSRIGALVVSVLASFVISVVCVVALTWFTGVFLLDYQPYRQYIVWLRNMFGTGPLMLMAGVLIFGTCSVFIYSRFRKSANQDNARSFDFDRTGSRLFRTLRWKLIFAFLTSVAVSGVLFVFLHFTIMFLETIPVLGDVLRSFINSVGRVTAIVAACFFLFLAVFFVMSNQIIRYLREITSGLHQIANGNLHYEIPVRSSDELGEVAYTVNQMAHKLSTLIEEERKAEKTKNDLITGVSHDLRTPLTSILGFLELIENDRYKDEVELRYYIGIAYEKSLSLKKLIDDLFEFTRVNNGMPLDRVELDLNGFIRQLLEEFVPNLEEAGMEGRVFSDDHALKIMADGDRLVRAFENLIMNAIQYGHEGRYVDVRLRRDGVYAIVEVVNYGEPIPEKYLPYIFERFYRVDASRSKQSGGTGLGLSIAKSIIELHNGTIAVKSQRGETVFEMRFPLLS
ncbi:putative sensor histidine kinase TcrY [compost metagenome]